MYYKGNYSFIKTKFEKDLLKNGKQKFVNVLKFNSIFLG